MASPYLNRIQIIGRFVADPELRFTPKGAKVTSGCVAVNKRWTNDKGEKQEKATFFNIRGWNRLAEIVHEHCRKGNLVFAEGEYQRETYVKDGEQKYFDYIRITSVQFLESKPSEQSEEPEDEPPFLEEDQLGVEPTQEELVL